MLYRTHQRAERIATLVIEKDRMLRQAEQEKKPLIYTKKSKKITMVQPVIDRLGFHDKLALGIAAIGACNEAGHTFLHINFIAGIATQEIANICSILFILSAIYLIGMRGYFYKQSWFFKTIDMHS